MAAQTWVFEWYNLKKIMIFHFVLFSNTFSFNSLSVFTLHSNILSWNLLKWPPYNAPLPDPPERNQDFENEKMSRPTTDEPLSDLNISYSPYAYAFTNFVFVCLFLYSFFFFHGNGRAHRLTIPFAIFFIFNRIAQKQVKNVWESIKWQRPFTKGKFVSETLVVVKKNNDNPIC